MADSNSPLGAVVNAAGALEISIGESTLAFAASRWMEEEAFEKSEGESNVPEFIIADEARWADEVRRELMREDEMGVTLLTRMLDKAFAQVLHHGSCAVSEGHNQGNG